MYLACATPRWALWQGAWPAPWGASPAMDTGMLFVVCPSRGRVDHNTPGDTTGWEQNIGGFSSPYWALCPALPLMFLIPPDRLGSHRAADFTAWPQHDPTCVAEGCSLPLPTPGLAGRHPHCLAPGIFLENGRRINQRSSTGGTGQPEETH